MIHTLPFDIDLLQDGDEIDMSAPTFDCFPIRSSIIFIRNTELCAKLDFSKCTYEQKAEYLKEFMFDSFNVDIPLLTNTWMEILLSKKNDKIVLPCLFNEEEIKRFVAENDDDIMEIRKLMMSLPLFALTVHANSLIKHHVIIDLSMYETTSYDRINLHNFASLTYDPDFVQMIEPIEGVTPKIYREYMMPHNMTSMNIINNNLPYMQLISLIVSPERSKESFFKIFNNKLKG